MAYTIATFTPVNVQLGGTDTGLNDTLPMPGPVPVGGGSISDDSDSTYLEMGSRYSSDEYGERADLLLADFAIDPAIYPDATWMHMSVRMRNETGYAAALDTYSLYPRWAWYRTDGGGSLFRQDTPAAITNGTADSPQWFDQVYRNAPISVGDPGDDTNWLNLPRDWPEMLDPLTTTGLRFGMYCTSSSTSRIPLIDVFEIRLVVAFLAADVSAPYVPPTLATPSLRMLQRGGSGGMSGIPRMIGNPTIRGSVRRGPGSIL